jgi:hypothetical protein
MKRHDESLAALVERVARELLVAVQRVRASPENPQPPAAAIAKANSGVCLSCDGKNQPEGKALKRGQCANCYPRTKRRLAKGTFTEAQLIAAGKLLPAKVGGRRDTAFPLDALADAAGILAEQNKERQNGGRKRKSARNNT